MRLYPGDQIRIDYTYQHGLESFSESKLLTIKKVTRTGNYQAIDEYGTGCTIKPTIFDDPAAKITLL